MPSSANDPAGSDVPSRRRLIGQGLFSAVIATAAAFGAGLAEAAPKTFRLAAHRNRLIRSSYPVADLERSLKFYVEGMGMREKWRRAAQGRPDRITIYVGYGDILTPELALSSAAGVPESMVRKYSNISLETTDLDGLLVRVAKAGGKVVRPARTINHPDVDLKVAFIEDPDGHQFEVSQFLRP